MVLTLEKFYCIAEAHLAKKVSDAVITVPAYFNDSQRQATKDAGIIAGLQVLRLLNEPTSVAIAYDFDKKGVAKRNMLVFDLGGGTLDVSILIIEDEIFEVKSIAGDTHLGGEDFDNRMIIHFMEEFKRIHDKDLSENKCGIHRLRMACERAKRILSSSSQTSIEIDSLHEGIDFYSTITRAHFEELNADLFRSTLELVGKALHGAKMDKSEIDEIILVGGSTRIPQIQILLQDFFDCKELNKSIDLDHTVAYGAAIQAAIIIDNKSENIKDILWLDVTPLSVGIETSAGIMKTLIKRNTTVPTQHKQIFTTYSDNQSSIDIKVYEGESSITKDNNFLGSFDVSYIFPAPRGVPQIEVTFDIDVNGILYVFAVARGYGLPMLKMTSYKGRLLKEDIELLIVDAEKSKKENEIERDRLIGKNSLEQYCFNLKTTIYDEKLAEKIDAYDKKKMIDNIEDTLKWIQTNQFAKKEQYDYKLQEIENIASSILAKLQRSENGDEQTPEGFVSYSTSE